MLVCTSRISGHSSESDNAIFEMRAHVLGRVHGIGFRAETKFLALRLHLTGYVQNCADGSVEIVAQGTKENLQALIDKLKNSFKNQQIEEVQLDFHKPKERYEGFQIKAV